MHYSPFTFVKNSNDYTMVAHDPLKQSGMGRQQALSLLDSKFVNQFYKCNADCTDDQLEQPCQNGGFVGPDCTCQCPDGIVGELCEGLAPSKTGHNCGGHFTMDDGIAKIESPNYPGNYPLDTQCYYLIEAPEGYKVKLHFEHFFIEEDDFCYWDQLYIRHDAPYYDTSAGLYCGRELEGVTLTSNGNTMMLDFNSDDFWPESGFSASFSFVEAWNEWSDWGDCNATCGTGYKSRQRMCLTESDCVGVDVEHLSCDLDSCENSGHIKVPAVGGCNPLEPEEVFDHIISKNYPSGYPANSQCTWTITLPTEGDYFGYVFFVDHIDVEASAYQCYDVLTIIADSKPPESFCGQILHDSIYFEEKVVIEFTSDDIIERTGFDVKYVIIPWQAEPWNEWSDWSDCSATCGTGYKSRRRACPPDSYCIGTDVDRLSCDLDPCENPCEPVMTHHVTETGGIIESPGYPFQYPKHYFIDRTHECFITVDVPDKYNSVTFSFSDLDIDCDYQFEYLEFVPSDGSSQKVYCNDVLGWKLEFSSSVDVIFWVADYLYHRKLFFRGFSMTYTYNSAE